MSDMQTDPSAPPPTPDSQINILAQYVRDISFENPLAPNSLRAENNKPQLNINIGVDARKVPDDKIENMYESVITLRAEANDQNGEPIFILELLYGTLVVLNDLPEDNHHPVMMIEIPRLSFPFVRQLVGNLTQQAGMPPLMLNPVDFHRLYIDRYKDEIEAAQKKAGDEKGAEKKEKPAKKSKAKDKKES